MSHRARFHRGFQLLKLGVLLAGCSGLVAWFAGRRALLARGSSNSATAFNAMYADY
jgi:hypothetical protein